jgi:hypothetical protein
MLLELKPSPVEDGWCIIRIYGYLRYNFSANFPEIGYTVKETPNKPKL